MRRVLFQIHLWMGLILSLPFLMLGITGSLLVFDEDITHLLKPQPALHASAGPQRSLNDIAAAAQAAAPEPMRVASLMLPEKPGDPAVARLAKRGPAGPPGAGGPGGQTRVSIDPATLAVMRVESGGSSAMGVVHRLHGNLMLQNGPLGRQIIGWFGVAMFVMGVSGLVLWWPRRGQWGAAFTIKSGAKGYRFNRDLHGAIGIWSWAVFLIVTFSGVYISFPQAFGGQPPGMQMGAPQAGPLGDGGQRERDRSERGGRRGDGERGNGEHGGRRADFDAAAAAAQAAAPDGRLLSISPGQRAGMPLRVTLAPPGWPDGAPPIQVMIDPASEKVQQMRDPRRFTPVQTLQAWMRPLHEGGGLGMVWKIAVFLIGFAPAIFVFTGVLMWLQKRDAKAASKA